MLCQSIRAEAHRFEAGAKLYARKPEPNTLVRLVNDMHEPLTMYSCLYSYKQKFPQYVLESAFHFALTAIATGYVVVM